MSILSASELFDNAFAARARTVASRPERPADAAFLLRLYASCSPLRDMVPPAVLVGQARMQADSFARQYPDAMRRVGVLDGRPVGRFVVDWQADRAHGVDLAVLPDARRSMLGLQWLRSWTQVADGLGHPCTLMVQVGNPAMLIYRRLGFEAGSVADPSQPVVTMRRPVSNRKAC